MNLIHWKFFDFYFSLIKIFPVDKLGILKEKIYSVDNEKTDINYYLMTNKNVKFKASMAYVGLLLLKKNHKLAHKIKHYFMAEPAFIKASLNQLEKDFGSLDNFFKEKVFILIIIF